MNRIRLTGVAVALLALVLTGCQKPDMDLAEVMKLPPRAPELAHLDAFVGTWHGIGKAKMEGSDKLITTSGVEDVRWEADGRLLVSTYEYTMADVKDKYQGIGVMLWDPKAKKVRSWSFSNYGEVGEGTMTYDTATRTWNMKGKGVDLASGHRKCGHGTVTFEDDNTQRWEWTEYGRWLFFKFKVMEFEGKSVRK